MCATQLFFFLLSLSFISCSLPRVKSPTVIAHRAGCGYVPEHTLLGVALSHAMNPDYIEPDVVMTKDDHLIVLHDIFLDTTTNVKQVFPTRKRADGHYYAIDFNLTEIKQLKSHERTKDDQPVYAERFPADILNTQVPTLSEWIETLQGLNKSRSKKIGIYVEYKNPAFHQKEGKNIGQALLKILSKYGYDQKPEEVYIQCFDPHFLKNLKTHLPKTQLLGLNDWKLNDVDYDYYLTQEGLNEVATYAKVISPPLSTLYLSQFVPMAKRAGLIIHPYTLRKDSLPAGLNSYEALKESILGLGVDGYFTDFPDL